MHHNYCISMRQCRLLILLLLPLLGLAQPEEDQVFSVKKRTEVTASKTKAYEYSSTYCYSKIAGWYTPGRMILSGDTLSIYKAGDTYNNDDPAVYTDTTLRYELTYKLLFSRKDSVVYLEQVYNKGSSGPMLFFNLNPTIREHDAYNLLCRFMNGSRADCPAHGAIKIAGSDSVGINGKMVNCLKVVATAEQYRVKKDGPPKTAITERFATEVTYYLDEKTLVPLKITEQSTSKKYSYCRNWVVSKIIE